MTNGVVVAFWFAGARARRRSNRCSLATYAVRSARSAPRVRAHDIEDDSRSRNTPRRSLVGGLTVAGACQAGFAYAVMNRDIST